VAATPSLPPVPERAQPAPPALPLSVLDQLWLAGERERYLAQALPQARALGGEAPLASADLTLVTRCASVLAEQAEASGDSARAAEALQLWELAANEQDPQAQMALGLWQARMKADGRRIAVAGGSANFKKAIRWLGLAGEQGLADAWYALSRIYIKPEFSQRNVDDAQRYLERAASMGHRAAQLECGNHAWRARRENENNDVRAIYWLQKAAAQGCLQAAAALQKIAPRTAADGFAAMVAQLPPGLASSHPLLAARLQLAALFGLTRAETLLLDVIAADQGHCLVLDIRASYGRSKRRLVAIASAQERQALDLIVEQFRAAPAEGNYRQRLYRLKTVLPDMAGEEECAYELAA
ncbi:MAG: tetratricopeptide repeat protein, partial [Massilia sp.]